MADPCRRAALGADHDQVGSDDGQFLFQDPSLDVLRGVGPGMPLDKVNFLVFIILNLIFGISVCT